MQAEEGKLVKDSDSSQSEDDSDGSDEEDSKSKLGKKRARSLSSSSNSDSESSNSENDNRAIGGIVNKLEAMNQKINNMQYEKVKAPEPESEEDEDLAGPKFELDTAGSEFIQSTMNLIEKDKSEMLATSKELESELDRIFSGAATKRQRVNPKYVTPEADTTKYLGVVDKKLTEGE